MGLYSSYSAILASGPFLYQESQVVYELITMINFLKHKGFTQNAKWLWLMALDQLVGKEPSVYVLLIPCLCAMTLWPKHTTVHVACWSLWLQMT